MTDDKDSLTKVIKNARKKLRGDQITVKSKNKEDLSLERANQLVLQPYKSHQTNKGRVINLPSKKKNRGRRTPSPLPDLDLKREQSSSVGSTRSYDGRYFPSTKLKLVEPDSARSHSAEPYIPSVKLRLVNNASTSIKL